MMMAQISEINKFACCEPGPFSELNNAPFSPSFRPKISASKSKIAMIGGKALSPLQWFRYFFGYEIILKYGKFVGIAHEK